MSKFIPYATQSIDDDDIQAVTDVLRSLWLTTGPKVHEFERAFAEFVGAEDAVAVSSGTAALHATMFALGIGPGDEVIVPAMTFAATANCVVFQGGTPVFCDVDPETLLIDPADVVQKLTKRTKAIISVDYAGQLCAYDILENTVDQENIALVADACHSIGGRYYNRNVGTLADLTAFSFHPVKHMTTGEGGMVTTNDKGFARRMTTFRNHGIDIDLRSFGSHFYDMTDLGRNYRITDFQCALGMSQLKKLPGWIDRRQEIAALYDELLADVNGVTPLATAPDRTHARHLYVVRVPEKREAVYAYMRESGIGVNVHYKPVHLHSYYRAQFKTGEGLCPVAEQAYNEILSLPMYPGLADTDVNRVVDTLKEGLA